MGGLVKKRNRGEYEVVDEDIQFSKRPRILEQKSTRKTRRNSYESSDESSSDSGDAFSCRPAKSIQADREISFNIRNVQNNDSPKSVQMSKPVKEVQNTIQPEIKPVSHDQLEEEVDDRPVNRRSPNGFLLPDPLPKGELLADSQKQEWVLGKAIGVGGFGELYLASSKQNGKLSQENFVIKIEPLSNGPLFVEVHFYIRATKPVQLDQFRRDNNIKHLGVPRYIASGTHVRLGQTYRFLVIERFGSDLQRILDLSEGGRFNAKTVCEISLQVLDSLKYIHHQGYVHKDVKASNLLVGLGVNGQHKVHLVDYGLSSRFTAGGIHKQYQHDLRWAHEGTLEYTSRDSHIGCSSRRGDIEVLVYNLVEWFGGSLPWDREFATPEMAKTAKFRAFQNPQEFLRHCFRQDGGEYPTLLLRFMNYIGNLRFEQEPNYNFLRTLVLQEMKTQGLVQDGRLEFKLGSPPPLLEPEAENIYLRPPPPESRVSAVFDRLCVSAQSWERAREQIWARRDNESLNNPTQAMLDILSMIKKREKAKEEKGKPRKRQKKWELRYW
ncbi:serine/threonine-protein kinase VRK1 isoform X2 [Eurytemora carolleeae]|uniref:serine/threonine-protein kinase VRK1 isoform X2 n=1 Tax=Eurytemora carolleeae TaxID=1294199 RepID=UPI000C76EA40|nr:serine/threonine-protein kinase VRK1 isoform X2 [Eurytemora carolleeae]|eukprot:XP_023322981.1 serine/threonine-protein kinase VRK1-like isoform X2 [Eurytemora affinis]